MTANTVMDHVPQHCGIQRSVLWIQRSVLWMSPDVVERPLKLWLAISERNDAPSLPVNVRTKVTK